jgi:hypothetical protein
MYCLIKKSNNLQLPIDMQVDLFDKLVKPILLYGCECWGFGNNSILEKVQLKNLKHIYWVLNQAHPTVLYMVKQVLSHYTLRLIQE